MFAYCIPCDVSRTLITITWCLAFSFINTDIFKSFLTLRKIYSKSSKFIKLNKKKNPLKTAGTDICYLHLSDHFIDFSIKFDGRIAIFLSPKS